MTENIHLSFEQVKVVDFNKGPLSVIASAGSGKTRVLTERVKRLCKSTKRKILAITFTNKAAEEIKERLSKDINTNKQVFTGTFHGFCQHILETRYKMLGLQYMPHIFESISDRLDLACQALEETPAYSTELMGKDSKERANFLNQTLEKISKIKRELIQEEDIAKNYGDDFLL